MTESSDARFTRGVDRLREIDAGGAQSVMDGLDDIAPDLGRYVVEFAFGDIHSRPGLGQRERQLVTLAVLVTLGGTEPQLEIHINGALNVGLSAREIVEAVIQCVPYAGFPRVMNAIAVLRRVFAERGVTVEPHESDGDAS